MNIRSSLPNIIASIVFGSLVSFSHASKVVLYVNFDSAPSGTVLANTTGAQSAAYVPSGTELVSPTAAVGISTLTLSLRTHSVTATAAGPTIGTPPPAVTGTRQGGKVLILTQDAGNHGEGLVVNTAANTEYMSDQDFTAEIVYYTTDPVGSGNTAGIQTMFANEWPFGRNSQFTLRTVSATDNQTQFWSERGDSNTEGCTTSLPLANAWIHDVFVYDYNNANPAQSTIRAYRNSTLIGTATYNAAPTGEPAGNNAVFFSQGQVGIGVANSITFQASDWRGLKGGIDAFALSAEALAPANFILPNGNVSRAEDWQLLN